MSANLKAITVAVFCAFARKNLPEQEHSLLRAFVDSIRRNYSTDAYIILLTDDNLDEQIYRPMFNEIRRFRVIQSELLLCRSATYHHTIANHHWRTPLVLLDYDILMLKRLDPIFTFNDDIFLTARNYSSSMPVNGGVLILNDPDPAKCRAFYESVLTIYQKLPTDQLQWWGDQISLSNAALAGCKIEDGDVSVTQSGARVRFIPRAIYNFTPYDVDSGMRIPERLPDSMIAFLSSEVVLAHFKGPRKHLMLALSETLAFADKNIVIEK
jgi:hypothetical protein